MIILPEKQKITIYYIKLAQIIKYTSTFTNIIRKIKLSDRQNMIYQYNYKINNNAEKCVVVAKLIKLHINVNVMKIISE